MSWKSREKERTHYDAIWSELKARVNEESALRGSLRSADHIILVKLCLLVSFILLTYLYQITAPVSPIWFAAWCLQGIASFFLIVNSAHDASHGTLFSSRRANRNWTLFCFGLLGIDGSLWGLRHLSAHHPHTNISGHDTDSIDNMFLRLSPHHRHRKQFHFQHLYAPLLYAIAFPHTAAVQDFEHLVRRKLPYVKKIRSRRLAWTRLLVVKLLYLGAFLFVPVLVFETPLPAILLGITLQQLTASLVFVLTICLNHYVMETTFFEDGEIRPTSHHLEHQLLSSADWYPTSRFWCCIMGGANAHTAHHLFPGHSHADYYWISRIIIDLTQKYSLPYNQFSFTGGLRSHFRFLRTLGKDNT